MLLKNEQGSYGADRQSWQVRNQLPALAGTPPSRNFRNTRRTSKDSAVNDLICRVFVAFQGRQLQAKERGATAVEYGMLVALIAAVIIATVVILGGQIKTAFETITDALGDETGA